jgi:hypothetical protein
MSEYVRKNDVFINCPFDVQYKKLFYALIFTIQDCGLSPRCSLEIEDSAQVRIDKIADIISQCQYGVHDISRTELDKKNKLPRFNMPLELGLFLGNIKFGGKTHQSKNCLIMDKKEYRYQKFCSDISGQDIKIHNNNEKDLIGKVRNWLRSCQFIKNRRVPSGSVIFDRYILFLKDLPTICDGLQLQVEELTFIDFTVVISQWLKKNNIQPAPQ